MNRYRVTKNCIIKDCRKTAVSHCGHVKNGGEDILAGWCQEHSRRFSNEPKADAKGICDMVEKFYPKAYLITSESKEKPQ